MSILITVQAGYVIKGINFIANPDDLKNFTLALNEEGVPISAASMHTSWGGSGGKNTIVIIPSDLFALATCFPVIFPTGPDVFFDIEVRDFHYDQEGGVYVLCGSRRSNSFTHAFVAVIDVGLATMRYNEYAEADMFYSIWAENATFSTLDYYVCGTSGTHGVIASINTSNLQMTNVYITKDDWEYHKIIAKQISYPPRFIVSGRNPDCTLLGFAVINPSFTIANTYTWVQRSEPASHCVVCDHIFEPTKVVLAYSYQSSVTLNLVSLSSPILISAYHYSFFSTINTKYNIQDIGMFEVNNVVDPRISIVGYIEDGNSLRTMAWHGYVLGLSTATVMNTNSFFGSVSEEYKHYKIKGNLVGDEFTGGYYQNGLQMSALFGTPLTFAPFCDHHGVSLVPKYDEPIYSSFSLSPRDFSYRDYDTFSEQPYPMVFDECTPFKGEEPAPELVMPAENESEIITYYDR
ncbi:MAG: hypothetical protein LBU83_11645, partial [Bacteroidales bacterium]|nr:hypothetical protein [Bacteroidales bacterium]